MGCKFISAHRICIGSSYVSKAKVEIDNGMVIDIIPFEEETHSTIFINGQIRLYSDLFPIINNISTEKVSIDEFKSIIKNDRSLKVLY